MAMKSPWATTSTSATATASARRCSGARTATPGSPAPTRSSFISPIIIDPEYHYESINVENQERNLSSLLNWMRRVTAMRRRYRVFGRGTMEFLTSDNTKVLTFLRRFEDEIILVVVNLSRFAQAVELDLAEFAGSQPREVFSQNKFPKVRTDVPYHLTVGPHGHFWLLLEAVRTFPARDGGERALPVLEGASAYGDLLSGPIRARLQGVILPAYLPQCRWFRSKARTIQRVELRRLQAIGENEDAPRLLFLDVSYTEGTPETYVLPLQILPTEALESRRSAAPSSPIATLPGIGTLCDASADESFQRALLALISNRQRLRDGNARASWPGSSRVRRVGRSRKWRRTPIAARLALNRATPHSSTTTSFSEALPQARRRREPRHRVDPFPE